MALNVGLESTLDFVSISINLKLDRLFRAHDSTAESPKEKAWFTAESLI
jgi:hypothetical protein